MTAADGDAPDSAPSSGATRVWQNDTLRLDICSFCDRATLTRVARVDDGGLRSGAKLLWGAQRPVKDVEQSLEKVTDEVRSLPGQPEKID